MILNQKKNEQENKFQEKIRTQNYKAVSTIGNIMKGVFGPKGLDKMIIDNFGEIIISNNGKKILKQLKVQNPIAKILIESAKLQGKEIGDGIISTILLASELLKQAFELVDNSVHPNTIINGYKIALKQAINYINRDLSKNIKFCGKKSLFYIAKTAMTSKIPENFADFFANLISDLMSPFMKKGGSLLKSSIPKIYILKINGKCLKDSKLIDGLALNLPIASNKMPQTIKNAKIIALKFPLTSQKLGLDLNTCIKVQNIQDLSKIANREKQILKERVDLIIKSGINVVLSTKTIENNCLKTFESAKIIVIRNIPEKQMKRICKATGTIPIISLININGDENIDKNCLGQAKQVSKEKISENEIVLFQGLKTKRIQTILLRGQTKNYLEQSYQSIKNAISCVKRVLETNAIVIGGGTFETSISVYLEKFTKTLASREQIAIAKFAESLLVLPKTLISNSDGDCLDLISKLRACHYSFQSNNDKSLNYLQFVGLDLLNNKLANNLFAGVLEPSVLKINLIKKATETAITFIRIDDFFHFDSFVSNLDLLVQDHHFLELDLNLNFKKDFEWNLKI
ncbi:t-complex protein 1 subunit alpha [Anaeramoeba ignava]|uniref:T-complex protein 1 subunit alpha n=1 Tax=Anaeramoeba ignava TaxID=1746090 RepID=A0A9Q0L6N7_ANAIG|nr:t-complex protein 1 subunit alpha [Anaeramoeba ignava]